MEIYNYKGVEIDMHDDMKEFKKEEIIYDKYIGYSVIEAIEFEQIEITPNFEGVLIPGYEIKDGNTTSFVAKELFENTYHKLGKINFSMALELLKIGEKISRYKWDRNNTTFQYLTLIDINQKKSLVMNMINQKTLLYEGKVTDEDLLANDYYTVDNFDIPE